MLIKVKVSPNSKENEIIRKSADSFEVSVRARPVKGMANRAVAEVLASYFKIPESDVRLVKGFRQKNKVFNVSL